MSELILFRGVPGSGKTTMALTLLNRMPKSQDPLHLEADMYFVDEDGVYNFDPKWLKQAHQNCLDDTRNGLKDGRAVIVSNTFSRLWELQPYVDLATEFDVRLWVYHVIGEWPNEHGVPQETINRMRERWEPFEGEIIVNNNKDRT